MPISIGTLLAIGGAFMALCVAGISTLFGVKMAGLAAAGTIVENKENFKNGLVLQALPQTQTIYAFIIALFIAMGTGFLGGGEKALTLGQGLVMFSAALLVAITSLSAIVQGQLAAAGIISCAKNPDAFVPTIVYAGQAETPAIFGFITALLVLVVGMGVLG